VETQPAVELAVMLEKLGMFAEIFAAEHAVHVAHFGRAVADAHDHAGVVAVGGRDFQAGISERQPAGGHGKPADGVQHGKIQPPVHLRGGKFRDLARQAARLARSAENS
jgi:hypothetical protein